MHLFLYLLVFALLASVPASGQLPPTCVVIPQQPLPGQSVYLFCPIQDKPNAPLVIYAHGYVNPNVPPPTLPPDQFYIGATPLPALVNQLGFAFAAPSYPTNGLAIVPGIADVLATLTRYTSDGRMPSQVFVAGVSEGALVAAKVIEQYPGQFNGAMALCGPIGDFRRQLNHIGDFRAVFDYYFPSIMPGSAVSVPNPNDLQWASLISAVRAAQIAQPARFNQPYKVLNVPTDSADPALSAVDILRYSYFGTDDARSVLGGNPFDNSLRLYLGSSNDWALNRGVERFHADSAALQAVVAGYETTGVLRKPLVTMHTTGDPEVPYWHMNQYGLKVLFKGSLGNYVHLPVFRYGHCAFEPAEVVFGFAVMVAKSGLQALREPEQVLSSEQERARFREFSRQHAAAYR